MFEKRHAKKLAESGGVRIQATVLTAKRGSTVSGSAIDMDIAQGSFTWKLTVRVEPPGEAPFEADISARLQSGNTFFPGSKVAVIYDPKNHSKVAFDQGRAATLAGVADQLVDGHQGGNADSLESVLKDVMADPSSAASRGQDLAAAMGIDLSTAQVHVRGQKDQPAVIQAQAQPPVTTAQDPVQLLAQLSQLHAQGEVTDAEFAAQKARLLGS
ncbi:MAG TPA: SHOCT domain-containing protein [Acidimicrobiales bacterium]|jgi:hypothetical protein|nr:SHOCT domain-containing protein [Acidimicrobiales bacterium]